MTHCLPPGRQIRERYTSASGRGDSGLACSFAKLFLKSITIFDRESEKLVAMDGFLRSWAFAVASSKKNNGVSKFFFTGINLDAILSSKFYFIHELF